MSFLPFASIFERSLFAFISCFEFSVHALHAPRGSFAAGGLSLAIRALAAARCGGEYILLFLFGIWFHKKTIWHG